MPDPVFPQGTTATIKDEPSGTATTLSDLVDVNGNTRSKPMARIDGLGDTEEKYKPIDKKALGTVAFVFHLTDDTIATNQRTTLETKWSSNQKVTIKVNYPGSFDNTTAICTYTGYIESIEDGGSTRDGTDPVRYTVTMRVTN